MATGVVAVQNGEMIGHRVVLTGLSTPGWADERGRIIGKRKDDRFLVLLDDGREAYLKNEHLLLIQLGDSTTPAILEPPSEPRFLGDEHGKPGGNACYVRVYWRV